MKRKISLLIALLLLPTFLSAEASEPKQFEMPRTRVVPIQDTQSGRPYELYIKLPDKYSENTDVNYPVIYFTDAVWHIEILSSSTEYIMEDVILVGISWQKNHVVDNKQHASRFRDYSISKIKNKELQEKYQPGQAERHLNFIRNDVIKYIEDHFRTKPKQRTYFGYSLGGLFGAYILLTKPDTFKNYILGSPTFQREIPKLSKLYSSVSKKQKSFNANVFLSYGSLEKESSEYVEKFIAMLNANSQTGFSLEHVILEGDHSTAFPMTGVRSVSWLAKLLKAGDQ